MAKIDYFWSVLDRKNRDLAFFSLKLSISTKFVKNPKNPENHDFDPKNTFFDQKHPKTAFLTSKTEKTDFLMQNIG